MAQPPQEDIINNRKVLREYHILDRFEAGIELRGTEIKSIRAGHANLNDAYVRVDDGQAILINADIQPYERASHDTQHVPKRERRLLLHKQEIDKLYGLASVKGHALVALRMYWKNKSCEDRDRRRQGQGGLRQTGRSEGTRDPPRDRARGGPVQPQARVKAAVSG